MMYSNFLSWIKRAGLFNIWVRIYKWCFCIALNLFIVLDLMIHFKKMNLLPRQLFIFSLIDKQSKI